MVGTNWILMDWTFKACDETEWLPAKVPGCVHTDLLRNGKIPAPFYGTNEHDLQWIDKKDWEYQTHFDLTADLLAQTSLELVFDGLDTYADVYVNDHHVLAADNMFRVWKADVKALVMEKNNHVSIRFRSPIQEDLPKLKQLGYPLPASNDQSELGGLGDQKLSVFARKAPYHYGWDWGPRFVTSGIWREARLEGFSSARITELYIRQERITSETAEFTAVVEVECNQAGEAVIKLQTEGQAWELTVELIEGINQVELPARIVSPQLWWCHGLGEPKLYAFVVELTRQGKTISEQSISTGFRSIRLVREKDGQGTSFYMEVNGVPVFAKGANHIPSDSFVSEVTRERYRHEILSAVESNMNMLRVWGGGIYEQRAFYELCDEYGVLVWQDFMFACSMYPGDEAFRLNVEAEAEQNVRRLRNHPCIALWCGNNEIDSAWAHFNEHAGWGWKQHYTVDIREKLWADYEAIFHQILPKAVEQYAPGTEYWPSSPLVELSNEAGQHATSIKPAGDVHYWGVWHNNEPFENYNDRIGRFMSEYGFQSFPEYESVRTYASEEDMQLESAVMVAHQKSGTGNRVIKEYMERYMNEAKDFPSFLYMSQVLQAEGIKVAIEAHRRAKPYCMGTLYWQLNDCWPVASWSSMDYYGKWKALQYYAKRSYQDVLLLITTGEEGKLNFHIVSDLLTPLSGMLQLRLVDFAGGELWTHSAQVAIAANTAGLVLTLPVDELQQGHDLASIVLLAEFMVADETISSVEYYFVPAKEMQLCVPTITMTEVNGCNGATFALTTDTLAKQVWLSTEAEGQFTDNFFDLVAGVPKIVTFRSRAEGATTLTPSSPGRIRVQSMVDFIVK
ncbi:MAG: glycoside hydrolase family 2 protein [Gorillibacterium sp.]|nr:glycoside hydrolase family 2 protein [Gorillibacterium sp.]